MDWNTSDYVARRDTRLKVLNISLKKKKQNQILSIIYISRVAASQLATLGCPELIASSRQEYQNIAVKLGTEPEYLKAIRAKVWKAREETPLFDCKAYAQGLETLFIKMWQRFARGENPTHISAKD